MKNKPPSTGSEIRYEGRTLLGFLAIFRFTRRPTFLRGLRGSTTRSILAGALAGILAASSVHAATIYWDGTTPAAWGTASNWSTVYNSWTPVSAAAPGSGDLAVFNRQNVNTAQVVDLSAAQAAQGLYFASTNTTLIEGGGVANQTLTLGTSGIRMVSANTSAGAVTIGSAAANQAVNLALSGSQSWKNDSLNLLTIVNGVSSVSGATTLTINSFVSTSATNGVKFNGVISNGGGTTALTIATGTGVIANGITTLTAANAYTGATTVQSGQLLLDFSAAGAPTGSGIINNTAGDNTTGSALVLGGGALFSVGGVVSPATLTLQGLSGGTNTQYFHNTTLQAGDSAITLAQNSAASLIVSLGTITRNANATLNFSVTPLTSGIVATTTNTTGLLGDWASTGNATTLSYATVNGSNQIVAYAGTAAATAANITDTGGTINYDLAVATGTVSATVSANTIRFTGAAATTAPGATLFSVNGLMNAGTGTWTINGGALTIGANKELVILGNAQGTIFNSAIKNNAGGASGLTYAGVGALSLYGASTYTGTTTLNAGTIYAGTSDVAGVSGALGNGGNITFSGGTLNYTAAVGAADYSTRIKNSTSAISIFAANRGNYSGASITLGGVIDSSNTGGMVVTGAEGYLTINGNNTYSGNTILAAKERISLGSGKAFGAGTVFSYDGIIFSASTDLTGANALANDFKFAGTTTSFIGGNSIELSGKLSVAEATQQRGFANNITHGTLTLSGGINISSGAASSLQMFIYGIGTTNVTGVIADNALGASDGGNISYYGSGTLSMSAANTYTGNTILGQGAGTIKLDFSAAGAPQNNIILSSSAQFQIGSGGGTLNLVGSATQDNSQTFTNGMQFGGAGAIVLTPNGHNLVLNAGAFIAASSAGSVTDITLSGASTATNGVLTSNTVDAGGLIKNITVGGNDWATKGTGASVGNIVAYSGYTTNNDLSTYAAASGAVNFSNSAAYTNALGAATVVNTVRFANNVASGFDLGTNQLTMNDGILVTSNVSGKAITITNGSLVSNTTGNADLVIINNGVNGTTLDISANLTNVNTAVITKSGQGLVSLSGTGNTFGGRVSLDQGVLKVADAVTTGLSMATSAITTAANTLTFASTTGIVDGQQVFGAGIASGVTVVSHTATTAVISGSAVTLATALNIGFGSTTATNSLSAATNIQLHGGVLGLTSDFTRSIGTGPGQLAWGASGGFAAYGADRIVNIGGNATPTTISWTTNLGDSSILILGASSADAMVTVLNPIDMQRQSQTIKVDNGSAAIDARLSGALVSPQFDGQFGLTKIGLGTLQLNAGNNYNGITQVLEGTLSLSATGSIATGSQLIVDGATAIFDLGNNKSQTSTSASGGVILDNGGSITGTGTSTLTGQLYDFRNGTVTAILGNSAATNLAPVTTLVKSTAGTVTLFGNNTYTGATTINAGTLQSAQSNALSMTSSVSVNNAGSTLAVNYGGASDYTQAQVVTLLGKTTFGAATTAFGFDTTNASANYTNNLTMAAGLTKLGSNTLTLTGSNTYTGVTTVVAGTLVLSGSISNGGVFVNGGEFKANGATTSAVVVASGATVSGSGTVGGLTIASGGTLAPGNSPGTLTAGATALNGGGNYNWQILDATGVAGTGYDTLSLAPGSVLTLNNTSSSKFNINLWSLSSIGPDMNGNAVNFNNASAYTWTLIATDQAISSFDANAFTINVGAANGAGGFSNPLAGGSFSVVLSGDNTDLLLKYTVAPEPQTWILIGLGLAVTLLARRFRIASRP